MNPKEIDEKYEKTSIQKPLLFLISVTCLKIFVNYPVMINTALTDRLLVRKLERSLCLK